MKVLALGEVLWDVYPDRSLIGGAPFNFISHLSKLGADSYFLSAVGVDELTENTLKCVNDFGLKDDFVFINEDYPTGTCNVLCDENGQPSYQLSQDTAFDNICVDKETIENIKKKSFDAFYFGTLAQRSEGTKKTLVDLLSQCEFKDIICDLNLRPNCFSKESIENCLKYSTILKINREEYNALIEMGFSNIKAQDYEKEQDFLKSFAKDIAEKYDINIIIITLDADGAVLYSKKEDKIYWSIKPKNKALSTVGAGDSFTACFLYNYLSGKELLDCINRAVMLSDYVVTCYDAIPNYPEHLHNQIR